MSSDFPTDSRARSKRAGENAETAVLAAVPELDYVSDDEAEHYDATVTSTIASTPELPITDREALADGTPVEIKSCSVVYGEAQKRGRFYLRETQHTQLLEDEGVYLFAVCEPREDPDREVIAMRVIPADVVGDEIVESWRVAMETRDRCYQVAWSQLMEPSRVEGVALDGH